MEFRNWFEMAESSDPPNSSLMRSELALAETLAYRDDSLRVKRANPNRQGFIEHNVKVV